MGKFYWAVGIIIAAFLIYFILVPAFAGQLLINPSFSIGFLEIRWYGVILATAILAGFFVAHKNSWRFGISTADVDDFSFWAVIVGAIGARLYYVIFNFDYFSQNLSEIYKIWHGGLSIYGALIFGLIFTYFYVRKKAYSFWQLFDLVAFGLPLAQAIGRLGNFVNQEAFGAPTNLPWKMFVAPRFRPEQFSQVQFFHPTFLYEATWDMIVFLILYRMVGRARSGIIGWTYLLLYSLGRFFIEGLRLDSFFIIGFRVDQVVALVLIILSWSMIFLMPKTPKA